MDTNHRTEFMDKLNRKTTTNTGFALGGVRCKLEALFFYSSSVQVDSFLLRTRTLSPKTTASISC